MLTGDDLRFFDLVAQSPSLAGASRALDVTASAVSQRLQQIEQKLGVRLVLRNGRGLRLTDEGTMLRERSRSIIDEIAALEMDLAMRRDVVSGQLAIVAPLGFGRHYVAPIAADFQAAHPSVSVTLMMSDRPGREDAQHWDVLVNIGSLRDSTLIAQRIAPNARLLCAAPAYLVGRPPIETPEDLQHHACIALRENDEDVTLWRFSQPGGEPISVRIRGDLASNDGETVREWGVRGHGLILRSEWSVAADLRAGRLVRVMSDWAVEDAPVIALTHNRRGRSARVGRFVSFLRAAMEPAPWRTEGAAKGGS